MAFNITDFNNKWANFKEELKDYFNKRVVDKNGDTMVGELLLLKDPENKMGVITRKFVEDVIKQQNEFVPGTLRKLTFGWFSPPFMRGYSNYWTNSSYTPFNTIATCEVASTYTPLSKGTVLINTFPKIDIGIWAARSRDYSLSRVYATANVSIKIMINDVVIIEEKNVDVTSTSSGVITSGNSDSIFCGMKNISAEIPVVAGEPLVLKMEFCVHSVLPFDSSIEYFDIYSSNSSMLIDASVNNPMLDTSRMYEL